MKNPFHKIPSFLDYKKKISPENYFAEIKEYFNTQINIELESVESVINQAEKFKEKTKLSKSTQESHIENLNEKFTNKPTKIKIFKLKNDLAIELNNQILLSEEGKKLQNSLKRFSGKNKGVEHVFKMLEDYNEAFNNIEGKYRKGKLEDSFNANYNELHNSIPQKVKQIYANKRGRKYGEQTTNELINNLTNSYYQILDKTTPPAIKESTEENFIDLSEISKQGTDHPIFEKASHIGSMLNSEVIVEEAHQQLETHIKNRNKRFNKSGKEKKLQYGKEVQVREVSKKVDVHIYSDTYDKSKDREKAVDNSQKKMAATYKSVAKQLGGYKEVYHDFKQEAALQKNNQPTSNETINEPDENRDFTMKISGKRVNSNSFLKAAEDRNVTIHHTIYNKNNPNYGHVPPRVQVPSTDKLSIQFDGLMKDPSKGTDDDRLHLANLNKYGEELRYTTKDKKTGKNIEVTQKSTGNDNAKGNEINMGLLSGKKKAASRRLK